MSGIYSVVEPGFIARSRHRRQHLKKIAAAEEETAKIVRDRDATRVGKQLHKKAEAKRTLERAKQLDHDARAHASGDAAIPCTGERAFPMKLADTALYVTDMQGDFLLPSGRIGQHYSVEDMAVMEPVVANAAAGEATAPASSTGRRLVQEEALFGGPPARWGGAHGRIVDAVSLRVGRGGVRTARREVRDRLPGHGREAGWRRSVGESTCKALR